MNHKEEWEFYFSHIDGKPGSFNLDMGLANIAPVDTMPYFFCVSLLMKQPVAENGLSSKAEADTLYHIEDQLVDDLKKNHQVIYAGRLTSDGTRDFFFYTNNISLIEKTVTESFLMFSEYEFSVDTSEDKEWSNYFEFIYPDSRQIHGILNRRTISVLENSGDKLSQPREVNHWIYFKTPESMETFISKARLMQFKIEDMETVPDLDREFKYKLRISRVDSVSYADVDKYVYLLWDLADECGGKYDGWETSVEAG